MKANKQLQFSLAIALALVNPLFAEDSNQELLKGSVEPATGESGFHSDQSDNPNSHTLGTVKVEADAIPENEIEDYYNPNYDGTNSFYKRSNSNTATKTDTPIMENPVSIQVVPRAVMDDQKSTRIKDVLENVSGVRSQASLGFGTGFIIRGFRTNRTYRNGLVADASSFHTDFEAANLESVDVLKGPAAVMFGRIEPGGLVNLNTKKPMFAPYYSVEQQFGNYDFYRTQWDATGDILGDGKLAYRFTGAYQNSNSFRDLVFNDRYSIAPSITWRPTEATDISLNIEGVEQDFQADYGIPAINGRPARIPTGNNFGDPNEPNDQISKLHIGTEINHRFNDDWAIHNRFLMSHLKSDTLFVNPANAFDPGALKNNRFLERDIFFQEDDVKGYSTNLDITGKFNIGSTKHNVLAGFDFTQFYSGYHTRGNWDIPNTAIPGRDSDNNPNTDLTIDIFNPRVLVGSKNRRKLAHKYGAEFI